MIYHYALGGRVVRVTTSRGCAISHPPNLSLLSISKQIHAEAASVLYGCNEFVFRNMTAAEIFLERIGQQNRTHLSDITIYLNVKRSMRAVGILLEDVTNLRRLYLEVFKSSSRHMPKMDEIIALFRGVLRKIGHRHTVAEFYDIVELGSAPYCFYGQFTASADGYVTYEGPLNAKQRHSCDHAGCNQYRASLRMFTKELLRQGITFRE